jgi:hypothetical protein
LIDKQFYSKLDKLVKLPRNKTSKNNAYCLHIQNFREGIKLLNKTETTLVSIVKREKDIYTGKTKRLGGGEKRRRYAQSISEQRSHIGLERAN